MLALPVPRLAADRMAVADRQRSGGRRRRRWQRVAQFLVGDVPELDELAHGAQRRELLGGIVVVFEFHRPRAPCWDGTALWSSDRRRAAMVAPLQGNSAPAPSARRWRRPRLRAGTANPHCMTH